MSLIDTLQKQIPSGSAGTAAASGLWLAGAVFGAAEMQSLSPLLPSWLLPLPQRIAACLCIVVAGSWLALFLMVRAYRKLERDHAVELARLAALPPAAGVQSVGLTTRRTRGQLLGDEPS